MNKKITELTNYDSGVIDLYGGYFVIAQDTTGSGGYSSRKISYSSLKSLFTTNIYNSDGQLTANRTVDLNNLKLGFIKGYVGIGRNNPLADLHIELSDVGMRTDTPDYDNTFNINADGSVSSNSKTWDITSEYFYWQTATGQEIYGDNESVYMTFDGTTSKNVVISNIGIDIEHTSAVNVLSPIVDIKTDVSTSASRIYADTTSITISCDDSGGSFVIGPSAMALETNGEMSFTADQFLFVSSGITNGCVAYIDSSGYLKSGSVTAAELNYLSGSTANIETRFNTVESSINALQTGIKWKEAARVAMSTNVNISSPGSTLDSISMTSGDRVLLYGQTTGSQNGVYVWNGSAVAMTRATDCDSASEIKGMVINIMEGTNADKGFTLTTDGAITVGITSLSYAIWGGTNYIGTSGRISVIGNVIDIDSTYTGQNTITTLGTVTTGTWNATPLTSPYLPATTVYTGQSNTYTAGMKQIFQADATNAGLKFGGVTANPSSPAAGDIWFRSDEGFLKYYSGAVKTLVDLSGAQTLTNKTIDLASNTITGTAVQFNAACSDKDFVFSDDTKLTDARNRKLFGYLNNTYILTGSTTNTVAFYVFVPAGTISANDEIMFRAHVDTNSSAASTRTLRLYANTTNDLTGTPVLLATRQVIGTITYSGFQRSMLFKNSVSSQEMFPPSTDAITDVTQTNVTLSSLSVDFSVDQYLIFALQLANSSDTIRLHSAKINLEKA